MKTINRRAMNDLRATLSVSDLSVTVASYTDSTITLSDGSITNYTISEKDYTSLEEGEIMFNKDWSEVLNNVVNNRVQNRKGFIYVDDRISQTIYIG